MAEENDETFRLLCEDGTASLLCNDGETNIVLENTQTSENPIDGLHSDYDPITYTYEKNISFPVPECPPKWRDYMEEKKDLQFLGWNRNRFTASPEFGGTDTPNWANFDRDTGFYAIWTPIHCYVSFDPCGGDVVLKGDDSDDASMSVPDMDRILIRGQSIGEMPSAEKDGYAFLGWFSQPIGGSLVTGSTPIMDDTRLYAQWQIYNDGGSQQPVYVTVSEKYPPDPDYTPTNPTETTSPNEPPEYGSVARACPDDLTNIGGEEVTVVCKWCSPKAGNANGLGPGVVHGSNNDYDVCTTYTSKNTSSQYRHNGTGDIYLKVNLLPYRDMRGNTKRICGKMGSEMGKTTYGLWQWPNHTMWGWYVQLSRGKDNVRAALKRGISAETRNELRWDKVFNNELTQEELEAYVKNQDDNNTVCYFKNVPKDGNGNPDVSKLKSNNISDFKGIDVYVNYTKYGDVFLEERCLHLPGFSFFADARQTS